MSCAYGARLPTLLTALRLPTIRNHWETMSAQADAEGWTGARLLSVLAELELAERSQRRIGRHLEQSRLPAGKSFESFDFSAVPMLRRAHLEALASGDSWLASGQNVLMFGPPGAGKTHLAAGLGRRLIDQGTPAGLYNTGSENSFFIAVSHSAAYVASKHAVWGLTDALRKEMPEHIAVGMIAPGFVGSELIPESMRPMGMPVDEFAGIILPQILAGEPYVVSHGYNQVRIDERQTEITNAYQRSAPREKGDERYDVSWLLQSLSN